jgi:hypothetical protein
MQPLLLLLLLGLQLLYLLEWQFPTRCCCCIITRLLLLLLLRHPGLVLLLLKWYAPLLLLLLPWQPLLLQRHPLPSSIRSLLLHVPCTSSPICSCWLPTWRAVGHLHWNRHRYRLPQRQRCCRTQPHIRSNVAAAAASTTKTWAARAALLPRKMRMLRHPTITTKTISTQC